MTRISLPPQSFLHSDHYDDKFHRPAKASASAASGSTSCANRQFRRSGLKILSYFALTRSFEGREIQGVGEIYPFLAPNWRDFLHAFVCDISLHIADYHLPGGVQNGALTSKLLIRIHQVMRKSRTNIPKYCRQESPPMTGFHYFKLGFVGPGLSEPNVMIRAQDKKNAPSYTIAE